MASRISQFQNCATAVLVAGISISSVTPALAQYRDQPNPTAIAVVIVITLIAVLIYFLPAIIAFRRQHPNRWVILLINTLFGATGLGWFGSLIWALRAVHISPTGNHGGESGLNVTANDTLRVRLEPSMAGSRTTADRLRELAGLHADGLLDDAEYQRLRGQVLQQLRS